MKYLALLQKPLALWLTFTILLSGLAIKDSHAMSRLDKEKTHFQLHLLKKDRYQLDLSGEPKDEWAILKNLDLSSESGFHITENDIESYNWPDQLITLTPEGSMKFLSFLGGKEGLAEMQKRKILPHFEIVPETVAFIVVLEGQKLYGGVFSRQTSARRTNGPTIFSEIVGIVGIEPWQLQVGFVMRPLSATYTPKFTVRGYKALDPALKRRIEIPKVGDFFKRIGKLTHDARPDRVEPWIPDMKFLIEDRQRRLGIKGLKAGQSLSSIPINQE